MEPSPGSNAVTGLFPDEQSAASAVAAMIEDGAAPTEVGTVRVAKDPHGKTSFRRGVVTGGLVGTASGVFLEGTVLAFPQAAIFVAGGTLAAGLAGLTVGCITGALASALSEVGKKAASVHQLGSALVRGRDRFLVTLSSADLKVRARARLSMRVRGAIETHDATDEDTGSIFVRGFATAVPRLRADLRAREGSDRRWEQVEHQYRFGWQLANRPDMDERSWSDASRDIGAEWERRHHSEPWKDVARYVAAGWVAARRDQTDSMKPRSGNAA